MTSSRRGFLAALAAGLPLHGLQHATGHGGDVRGPVFQPHLPAAGSAGDRWRPPRGAVALRRPQALAATSSSCTRSPDRAQLFFSYVDTLVARGLHGPLPGVLRPTRSRRRRLIRRGILAIKACGVFSEFECFERSAYSPLNPWLVALAVDISGGEQSKARGHRHVPDGHSAAGDAAVRAAVVAPVLCQPTLPIGKNVRSARDFGLPSSDFDFAYARVHAEGLKVLLIRYKGDKVASAERAARLVEHFRPRIEFVEPDGDEHSSLVHHPDAGGLARGAVIRFLKSALS